MITYAPRDPEYQKQKNKELNYAKAFVAWLNATYSWDYNAYSFFDESSIIDAYAVSASGRPRLNLQLTASSYFTLPETRSSARPVRCAAGQAITHAIRRKEMKPNYSLKEKQTTILVVEGLEPEPTLEDISECYEQHQNSDFMGIYYITVQRPTNPHPGNSDVYQIKDAFPEVSHA